MVVVRVEELLNTVIEGDCIEVMQTFPDNSFDLIATDPPYHSTRKADWDKQWRTDADYLDWIGALCEQWRRILKPNGSLYVFASPKMAARVECKVSEYFNVLNRITWRKPPFSTKAEMFRKGDLRTFFPASEAIIFAEHYGADNIAKGEVGYAAKCDELRGFVFEPIRAYLDDERRRAGVPHRAVIQRLGMKGHDSHFFSPVQWKLPLPEQYEAIRELFNLNGGDYLRRDYYYLRRDYEDLHSEYEDLRRDYESLRRPFSITADVPYTDVWDFPTVSHYPGKHECEKPVAMMEHIIKASSRLGAVVLDCFFGSGATGEAALNTGRFFVGVEKDAHWVVKSRHRLDNLQTQARLTL